MENPWARLKSREPFVLSIDAEWVNEYQHSPKCQRNPRLRINTSLRPVPFIGNPKAPIVLMTLNPDAKPGDLQGQSNSVYRQLSRRNLSHQEGYYYLNRKLPECPGKSYAEWMFRALLRDVKFDSLYSGVFLAQYFPYHTNTFKETRIVAPSQHYTFQLVDDAVARGALVVILRSKHLWVSAVPSLVGYRNCFECVNRRRPTISLGGVPDAYHKIVKVLNAH